MKLYFKYTLLSLCCLLLVQMAYAQMDCGPDIMFVSPADDISGGAEIYSANEITADIVIENDANIELWAHVIRLNDGFQVEEGSTVLLNDCTVSVQQIELSEHIRVSPNPVTFYTNIAIELETAAAVTIYLTDMQGRIVETFAENVELSAGETNIALNVATFPSGMYLIQLTDGQRVSTRKVVKL